MVLGGEKSLGTIADGRLEAPVGLLSTGSRLELELRKDGFHTLETAVTAIPVINLPELLPARKTSLDLAWNSGQLLGVTGTYSIFPIPDWVFAGGALGLSVQIPSWDSTDDHVVVHLDLGARAGLYLLPAKPKLSLFGATLKIPLRIGVVTGFGAMPSFGIASGFPTWIDLYLLMPMPFIELGTNKTVVTFRVDQRYSLGLPGSAIERGWMERRIPDPDEEDGIREVIPVVLGVTFKW